MRYSYSNISTFAQCPRKWKYVYNDHLKTIPDQEANNPLYLGTAIHLAFETGNVQDAIYNYKSNYYVITDLVENECIKLEYFIPKVLELLPQAECEVEISTPNFIGYIDRLVPLFTDSNGIKHYEIWDYKYCAETSKEKYLDSPQLSLYKWYFEQTHPGTIVDHLRYVFIPKINIKQKWNETIFEFRQRLQEHLDASEIKIIEVPFNSDSITQFESCCQQLHTVKSFPKNETKLCNWCAYQKYCESDGKIDYMIL